MSSIKIYHNPRCSKSRKTLEIIESKGFEPEIIKYLETPPSILEIKTVLNLLDMKPRDLMRKNEVDYKENQFNNDTLSDEQLIEMMHKFPKVIERPIVLNKGKAVIGRPPESVLDII